MRKHKKIKRGKATEKLDLLMQELEAKAEPVNGAAAPSSHRIY